MTKPTTTVMNLGWGQIERQVDGIARQVHDSGRKVKHIIAVSKGGIIPAGMFHQYYPEATFSVIRTRHYTPDHSVLEKVEIEAAHLFWSYNDEATIVIDEICDSGKTFIALQRELPRVMFASLYVRESSKFNPEFWGVAMKEGIWLNFPWEQKASS